ncbi:MAG: site-2 protease family protein [Planctomycetes bacterium]|nr:site-2 protease family protein [Planctomycetota bacterium]
MFAGQGYRDNPINWSLTLGRVFGIRVRMHLLFILWIVFRFLSDALSEDGSIGVWAVITVFLFGTVLLHEFGHCFGARAVGGDADDILLWPLGGLATVDAPMNPRAQFITTAAGPMVNVVFCVLAATLFALTGNAERLSLNPFHLMMVSSGSVTQWGFADWLVVFWSINYLLLLFNLLPTFPMDGGRLLQAIIWKYRDYRTATLVATLVGMVGAIIFGLIGLATEQFLLLGIAFFGYFTCWQQRQMVKAGAFETDNEFGYDFSKGFDAFQEGKQNKPSWLARRRTAKLARKAEQDRQRQAEREKHIDDILDKVHREGMQSLTPSEKRILQSETDRKQQV